MGAHIRQEIIFENNLDPDQFGTTEGASTSNQNCTATPQDFTCSSEVEDTIPSTSGLGQTDRESELIKEAFFHESISDQGSEESGYIETATVSNEPIASTSQDSALSEILETTSRQICDDIYQIMSSVEDLAVTEVGQISENLKTELKIEEVEYDSNCSTEFPADDEPAKEFFTSNRIAPDDSVIIISSDDEQYDTIKRRHKIRRCVVNLGEKL